MSKSTGSTLRNVKSAPWREYGDPTPSKKLSPQAFLKLAKKVGSTFTPEEIARIRNSRDGI